MAPLEWYRIPLASPDARERSVRALVDRTLPNRDEFATKRHELKQLIDNLTWEAASKDGLEMYLSTQTVLGVPISASLVVTAESPDEDSGIGVIPVRLMAEAQQDKYPQAEVEVVDLPAGRAVRVRRQERPQDASDLGLPEGRTSTLLTYFVQIPESPTHLVLSFNTPLTELADALVELFDAVAHSLTWEWR
ncbi:hypothetical protein [Streptomyces sp. 6N223]|uniref:hypothetical protein n=1 Tax=Streptomyces sp. 6N223 TaxID=3457412 RepID=UPI003FD16DE9